MFDRIFVLIDKAGIRDLERKTGIKGDRWSNIKHKRARAAPEEIEALGKVFPEYRWWLMTGETMPEAGQISPEVDEVRSRLKKTGTDT